MQKDDRIINLEEKFLDAIGQRTRLKLIYVLKDSSMCLCEIGRFMDEDISTVCRHLNILKNAGILSVRRKGVKVIYEVKDRRIFDILSLVEQILKDDIKGKILVFGEGE